MTDLLMAWAVLRGLVWGLRRNDTPRVMTLVRRGVRLSRTTYRIGTPIVLRSGQTLRGAAGASTILSASGLNEGEAAVRMVGHDGVIENLMIVSAPIAVRVISPLVGDRMSL